MTTIVANLECMAADHRVTSGGPIAHVKKIHRIADSLYGLAGDIDPGFVFLEWLASSKPDKIRLYRMLGEDGRNNFTVLELSPKGLALWSGWGVRVPILDTSYAIGTGAMSALSHVKEGESPEKAIRRAAILDECSGVFMSPQVEWLLPPELQVKKKRSR
jgi:hypothetical protein